MTGSQPVQSWMRGVRAMGAVHRFVLFGLAAAAVAGVWLVSRWASEPTYVTLYRELELNDAGAIEDRLQKADIRHKLAAGGTEVLVPAEDVAKARVALAKDGAPGSGRPGLELFDKPSWGMTDFTQRVTYQRALEGELARTVGRIRGVERAQVHLVIPDPSPLRRLDRPASASVVLTLRSGVTLPPEAVQGITYIVSNSVEQLASDNVAVMDDAGHVLSVPTAAGAGSGMTSRQLDMQRSLEQQLSGKVEELLTTILGQGHVRATVSAELSFDQVDRTVETYDPDKQVIQSEQRSETQGAGGEGGTGETVFNNQYQNSRVLERNQSALGKVSRLTVAVLVDDKALKGAGAGGRAPVGLGELEAMVKDAVGADSARGDRVSVLAVPFGAVAAAAASQGAGAKPGVDIVGTAERVGRPVVGVAALVVLLLLAWRLLLPAGTTATAGGAPETDGKAAVAEGAGLPRGAETLPAGARFTPPSADRSEATAQVLREWLGQSR